MKDRVSGSIGRRLIWSGRVVFIGRDAAFEGVIANAVRAGFHRVTHRAPPIPLGSRDPEIRYRLHSRTPRLGWWSASAALNVGIITALDADNTIEVVTTRESGAVDDSGGRP